MAVKLDKSPPGAPRAKAPAPAEPLGAPKLEPKAEAPPEGAPRPPPPAATTDRAVLDALKNAPKTAIADEDSAFNNLVRAKQGARAAKGAGRPAGPTISAAENFEFKAFLDRLAPSGVRRTDAARLFALAGGDERDPVTSLSLPRHLAPTLARARELAAGGTPVTLVKLEAPYNLKGVNAHLNATGANELMRELVHDAKAALKRRFGAENVHGFRASGPASFFVVTGAKDAEVAEVLAKVQRAAAEKLAGRTTKIGGQAVSLAELPHPEHAKVRGTGLAAAIVPVDARASDAALLGRADKALDAQLSMRGFPPPAPPPFSARLAGPLADERGPPRPPVAGPPPGGFANSFEVRRAALAAKGDAVGAPPDELARLWSQVAGETDPVTSALSGTGRMPTLASAIELVKARPDARAVAVLMDVGNLSGLTKVLGRREADGLLRAVVGVVKEELEATGAKVDLFRHGGDELMAVVTGDARLTEAAVRDAGRRAEARIRRMNANSPIEADRPGQGRRIADIPHPKHPGDARYNGVGLYLTALEIAGNASAAEIAEACDAVLELEKKAKEKAHVH